MAGPQKMPADGDLEAAGLYDPAAPNAAERRALLEWFAARGVGLDEMIAAHREGRLVFAAASVALRPGRRLTLPQVAERLGMPLERVEAYRLAFGLPPVAPDEPFLTEREATLFGEFAVGAELFGEASMRRLARVIGHAVARITEAMVSTNRDRGPSPALATATELDRARWALQPIETVPAPIAMIQGLLPVHLDLAGRRLRQGRLDPGARTTRAGVGFVDLVGFTTLARRMPVDALAAIVDRFEEVAHDVATTRRARVVKFIGDEVMFVAPDPATACDVALTLVEAFADDGSVTPRGGVAYGDLMDLGGDYYGPVVNLASRAADVAVPRELLASEAIADGLPGAPLRCEPAGRRLLRGFEEPVRLFSVTRA